ncbi:MAG: hypothetical protein PHW82_12205 [Bacteroidales bacterium]|nr:hypothetical protein [Bacteroidales bacterium]
MKTIISICLVLVAVCIKSQEFIPFPDLVQINHDSVELAREGRNYSFTNINELFNSQEIVYFGYNLENRELACINGKALPPFECKDFFVNNYKLSGNTVYLNTKTSISCKRDSEFQDTEVNVRLKIITKDKYSKPINFVKKGNLLLFPVKNDFNLYVVMEMSYNLKGETETEWKPVLDLYDTLPTNPKYLIFTSFEVRLCNFTNSI